MTFTRKQRASRTTREGRGRPTDRERIETTITKAKELRPFAEKIITQAKDGKHYMVRRVIQDKVVYKKLFDVIAPRYAQRPGGYTRIMHLAPRPGDNATRGLIALIS